MDRVCQHKHQQYKIMSTLLYYSYGSNMSTPRLLKRTPSAKPVSIAYLNKHKLKFHKISKYGSGKCDIEFTNHPGDVVIGVLYEINPGEVSILDKIEGLGNGYGKKSVSVVIQNGKTVNAVTYYATKIDDSLKPYHWYKEHVIRGAREHNLPGEYIKSIESVESIPDPDPDNHEKELLIYR